jgi:hypothetical protein
MFPDSIIRTPICAGVCAMFDLQPQWAGEESLSSNVISLKCKPKMRLDKLQLLL